MKKLIENPRAMLKDFNEFDGFSWLIKSELHNDPNYPILGYILQLIVSRFTLFNSSTFHVLTSTRENFSSQAGEKMWD